MSQYLLIIGQHIAVVTNIAQGSGQGVGARCLGTHTHRPVSPHAKCNEMQSSVECECCTVFYLHLRDARKDASHDNCFLGSFEDLDAI